MLEEEQKEQDEGDEEAGTSMKKKNGNERTCNCHIILPN